MSQWQAGQRECLMTILPLYEEIELVTPHLGHLKEMNRPIVFPKPTAMPALIVFPIFPTLILEIIDICYWRNLKDLGNTFQMRSYQLYFLEQKINDDANFLQSVLVLHFSQFFIFNYANSIPLSSSIIIFYTFHYLTVNNQVYNIQMGLLGNIFGFLTFILLLLYMTGAFHVINYGNIGVYKRGGALLSSWTEPGLHFMIPFLTTYYPVQVTIQTDKVTDIPCGTSSGVILRFEKIEVVNRLKKQLAHQTIKNYTITYDQTWIFSKIHHEINQFCSGHTLQEVLIEKFNQLDQSLKVALQNGCNQWAPGIEIIAVRVTKPKVPQAIAETFQQREVERTKLRIKQEQQKLKKKQSQTQKKLSQIDAQTISIIESVNNKMNLLTQNNSRQIEAIENQILTCRAAANAQAKKYRQEKLIELNRKRLIPQKLVQNILENLKATPKNIYEESLQEYLAGIDQLIPTTVQKTSKGKEKEGK